ncbi:hypothetical protein RRG08_021560 [Elysia crispata]|nr:hypothetical protein RRG08_021560 [Elysia crispata]
MCFQYVHLSHDSASSDMNWACATSRQAWRVATVGQETVSRRWVNIANFCFKCYSQVMFGGDSTYTQSHIQSPRTCVGFSSPYVTGSHTQERGGIFCNRCRGLSCAVILACPLGIHESDCNQYVRDEESVGGVESRSWFSKKNDWGMAATRV